MSILVFIGCGMIINVGKMLYSGAHWHAADHDTFIHELKMKKSNRYYGCGYCF